MVKPLWLLARQADIATFPYAEVEEAKAATLVTGKKAQYLGNEYAWTLKYPDYAALVTPPRSGVSAPSSDASTLSADVDIG